MQKGILLACFIFLLSGSLSFAEESNKIDSTAKDSSKGNSQVASQYSGNNTNNEELIKWLNSVKPAAGNTQPGIGSTNYWEQTVTRSRRQPNH